MEVTSLLQEAQRIIDGHWCQFAAARDRNGNPISPRSNKAVTFCISGAIYAAAEKLKASNRVIRDAFTALHKALKTNRVAEWNDVATRTFAEVLAACGSAIAISYTQEASSGLYSVHTARRKQRRLAESRDD